MNDLHSSSLLWTLSDDYANNRISFQEYRSQRKILLCKIDEEYNGLKRSSSECLLYSSSELT